MKPNPPSVLIVDQSDESREVLSTILAARGWQILSARRPAEGATLAREHAPQLIVVDLERGGGQESPLDDCLEAESRERNTPLVMLGRARRLGAQVPVGQFVTKPYHYGPLIRTMEALLRQTTAEAPVE